MKGTLEFKPAARLQYILTEELVSDPNVAVMEFVKNAYDADATKVTIDFDLNRDRKKSSLVIADDGEGMDAATFEQNWMHPGYSAKAGASATSRRRIPVGEKGLGRLASGRLGETLDVYTRRFKNQPWQHAHFRWSDFNDMNRDLQDIKVAYDDETPPPDEAFETGTVIQINGLKLKWDSRFPGRKVKNKAPTRLGRLRQDLEVLLLPLTASGQEFEIELNHNSELYEDESGKVQTAGLALLDYRYRFELVKSGKTWVVKRVVTRSKEVAETEGLKATTRETIRGDDLPQEIDFDGCGPFWGEFYYAPRSANQLKNLDLRIGVRVYRDNVRIDPYGDPEDDWLGAAARKAIRQGHAPLQPNTLYGAVHISKKENRKLNPLANREGLIENDAFDAFMALCRSEFMAFGDLIQEEYLDPKWERQQAKKRRSAAIDSTRWATAISRAAAHAIRQPITSADSELSRLQRTINRSADEMPAEVRRQLQQLHDLTREHLERIDDAVGKMLGFLDVDPVIEDVEVPDLINEVIERVEPDAQSQHVRIEDRTKEHLRLRLPTGVVEHALEELMDNAIRAPRPEGRAAEVVLDAHSINGNVRIAVIDNASGIPEDVEPKLFQEMISRSGHIGVGLMWNRQLLQIARGDIELVSTGRNGTRFDIVLPVNGGDE